MSHVSLYQLALLASIRASKDGMVYSGSDKLAVHALERAGRVQVVPGPLPGSVRAFPAPAHAVSSVRP